jgi:3-oxoacyl-[acyl-carrier-protein] synthase-3
MASVAPEEVDLIVCGTITPDNVFPSTACHLQHQLGCVKAGGMDVSAACSGFIYALSTAWAYVRAGLARNVLCVGAEKLSTITDFRDRTSCILFGDGAGAALVRPSDGPGEILFSSLHALGGQDSVMSVPGGGSRMPASHESVETRQHFMRLKGREVFKFAVSRMVEEIEVCAAKCGVGVKDIAMVVPHQVNMRILEYASEKLGYPLERMAINIDRYGNTSSASVPLALDEAVRAGRIKKGDLVVMVGFGAGLTWGSVALRW